MKKLLGLLVIAFMLLTSCEPTTGNNNVTTPSTGKIEIKDESTNNTKKVTYVHTKDNVITIFSVEKTTAAGETTYTGTIEQLKKTVYEVIWDNINAITELDKYITFEGEAIIPEKTDTPDANGFYSLSYSGVLGNDDIALIRNAIHVTIKLILTTDAGKNETYIVPKEFSEKVNAVFR